jgi:hypothetical protein
MFLEKGIPEKRDRSNLPGKKKRHPDNPVGFLDVEIQGLGRYIHIEGGM